MNKTELRTDEQSRLSAVLLPDEEIQWVGRSEAFPLVSRENKNSLLVRWIVSIACIIVLTVLYVVFVGRSDRSFNIIVELIIIVACAYFGFLVPVLDRNTLTRRALYCLTSKRVLVLVGDRPAICLNRAGLKSRCVVAEKGCVHILFGASIDTRPSRYRITTIVPQTDKQGENSIGAVFYNIKKDDIPENILSFS